MSKKQTKKKEEKKIKHGDSYFRKVQLNHNIIEYNTFLWKIEKFFHNFIEKVIFNT